MHKVDGAEFLGILIRKLTENWEKLCDEYLDEDEARPYFRVSTTTIYIKWSRANILSNITLISDENDMPVGAVDGALNAACDQIDDMVLNGYPIIDDVIIKRNDDNTAEYGKMYTILAENLATMMTDVRVPELLLDYLYLCQKICIGRYLYEIRDIITDDVVTGADILNKMTLFCAQSKGELLRINRNDPLSRFDIVTYDRKAIKYVGVGSNHIRYVFKTYNQIIERSRTFYVPDDIYNS
jgi:hypothetical protein